MNKNPFSLQIDPKLLEPATEEEQTKLVRMRTSLTYWQDALRRLRRNPVAMVSIFVIVLVALFAFLGPLFMPYDYDQLIKADANQAPSAAHWLGTDGLGRDTLVRVMFGTRISLIVGITAAFIILIIGTLYGAVSGYIGGRVDNVMMRIVEILYSVPDILIVILLMVVLKNPLNELISRNPFFQPLGRLGPSVISMFITFASLYWVGMARIVRGQVLVIKEQEYVLAAKVLGVSHWKIITRHLIPNCIGPIIVTTTFQIPSAIFVESFLSFIGLGISAPMASLGSLASDAMQGIYSYTIRLVAPSLVIAIIILAFQQLGDGLRDALDPKMKK